MSRLRDVAALIRSKNAGPFNCTIDIMMPDVASYERVVDSGAITAETVAALYPVPAEQIKVFHVQEALAVKVSMPRPVHAGDPGDRDIAFGQQFAPLMDVEV
jgi:hypothetical protein